MSTEAKEVCRAFRNQGKCKYGKKCKYEHSEGEAIPRPPRLANEPCHYYQEHGVACHQGRFCPFYHGEEDKGRVVPDICRRFRRGECQGECSRIHATVAPEELRPEPCGKWVRTGECKAHEQSLCIYEHKEETKGSDPNFDPAPNRRRGRRTGNRENKEGAEAKVDGDASAGSAAANAEGGAAKKGRGKGRGKARRPRAPKNNGDAAGANPEGGDAEGGAEGAAGGSPNGSRRPRRRFRKSNICYRFQTPEGCDRVDCPFEHTKIDRSRSRRGAGGAEGAAGEQSVAVAASE